MKKITILFACILFTSHLFSQGRLPFEDKFESDSLNPSWWSAHPNIDGVDGFIAIEENLGTNSTRGVKIGKLNDNTGLTTNALDLHIDLENQTDVELSFWIAGIYDDTDNEDGIYFSNDGGTNFKKVVNFFPSEWCGSKYGQHPPIDIDGLAASVGLTLTPQFVIRFQQRGKHDFSGSSGNLDGFYLDDVKAYDPNLTYSKLPFEDNFNNGQFKNSWAWNFADSTSSINSGASITNPMSIVEVQNEIGVNKTYGVKIGRRCDGTFTTNALDLHLNLENQTDVELSFWVAGIYDETDNDDGIYFSNDGGANFKKALDFFPGEWCGSKYGQHPPIDIDGLAASVGLTLTPQFVIRFQQRGKHDFSGSSGNLDGFYLDDVKAYDPNLTYSKLPFEDDFNNGQFKNSWAWNFADSTSSINSGASITNPMSIVEVQNEIGVNKTYGIKIGRRCDGTFTTNALDLHLDLKDQKDVELSFWIAGIYDETDNDDGIYFSNDGGTNFKKALDFFPSEWCGSKYGQHPPIDIDGLAASVGLTLTPQFVIRFQQRGKHDFSGSSGNLDGFYLDDVKVYDPILTYGKLPFEDDFNNGQFKNSWAWNFADSTSSISSSSAITSPMSVVSIQNEIGVDKTFGVKVGRRCDGHFTTNALDLHLNLKNQSDINMTFSIADIYDETDIDDGIYFSNDEGINFKKVFDFDFTSTPNNSYVEYSTDVSNLSETNQIGLTEKFVVRFQQRGKDDFSGSSGNLDGFYLDNVKITGMPDFIFNPRISQGFNIYPNPNNGHAIINVKATNQNISKLVVLDVIGKKCLEIGSIPNNYNLDISSLRNGFYYLSLVFESGDYAIEKLIKE